MALSMDEQRMLAEIEQRLARSEPGLAQRFAALGRQPAPARGSRPRVHLLAAVAAALVVAAASLVVYTLVSWRGALPGSPGARATAAPPARAASPAAGHGGAAGGAKASAAP